MLTRSSPLLFVFASLLVFGCGDDDGPSNDQGAQDTGLLPGTDAQSNGDAASSADAQTTTDATTSDDATVIDAASGDAMDSDASADAGRGDGSDLDAELPDVGPTDGPVSMGDGGGTPDGSLGDGGAMSDGGALDAGVPPPMCDPNFGQSTTACGGNPAGSWRFVDACGPPPLQGTLTSLCPTAGVRNLVRTATGSLGFSGSTYRLDLSEVATGTVSVPPLCAFAAGGCAMIVSSFSQLGVSGTCRTLSSNGCVCSVRAATRTAETGNFTRSGARLMVGTETYDHCVRAPNLELRQRSTNSVYVLQR